MRQNQETGNEQILSLTTFESGRYSSGPKIDSLPAALESHGLEIWLIGS
jgi:hypothetical protein